MALPLLDLVAGGALPSWEGVVAASGASDHLVDFRLREPGWEPAAAQIWGGTGALRPSAVAAAKRVVAVLRPYAGGSAAGEVRRLDPAWSDGDRRRSWAWPVWVVAVG